MEDACCAEERMAGKIKVGKVSEGARSGGVCLGRERERGAELEWVGDA